MSDITARLAAVKVEMQDILQNKMIPFWLHNSIDAEYGGYLTSFNENGELIESDEKYIVTQARMLWGFSYLSNFCQPQHKPEMIKAAKQGYEFLIRRFWDKQNDGFAWKTDRAGNVLVNNKLTYGEGFALYALAEYSLLEVEDVSVYLDKLLTKLSTHVVDTLNGGYFENLESDWSVSPGGECAGDRKSLDIHMHIMEAYTTLHKAQKSDITARRLRESIAIILRHMVNADIGYGYNQFDIEFNKKPAINIPNTWNAERCEGEAIEEPTDSTSYGHNVELSWLMLLADEVLGDKDALRKEVGKKLLDHSLTYGYDYEFGGVYRDGVADQKVLVTDKEWWQNFEALVGYSNGFLVYGDEKYAEAFLSTWAFIKEKFMNMEVGESRQLLDRKGNVIAGDLGNPWKGMYHTGRAIAESIVRLQAI